MSNTITEDYIANYAEAKASSLAQLVFDTLKNEARFEHVVVIPCFDESPAFAERLHRSALWSESTLVVVVINQTLGSPLSQKNHVLWQYFINQPNTRELDDSLILSRCTPLSAEQTPTASAFLAVDCFRPGKQLPTKQGVGIARKLGCDMALCLQAQGLIVDDWIYSTDADTHLPNAYFSKPTDDSIAMVFDHQHIQVQNDVEKDSIFLATQLYEQAINYYTAGLVWAKSPYAFPTLGSCLAVRADAYAHSRGFPKRAAAEDFYLLNKLAKIGIVSWRKDITIRIEARLSGRNPFGTGPAVTSIIDKQQSIDDYCYYAPESFFELKALLETVIHQLANTNVLRLTGKMASALADLKIDTFIDHLEKQHLTGRLAVKAWHDWFDAFKTLKFIRYLQQHHYPSLPLQQCLKQAPFA